MASIELRDLRKTFQEGDGEIVAVDDVNISVDDSEFLVLVGPSGCGKSTTLRCISGLEGPTGGKILFDDEDVTDLSPRKRNVAMVFQDYALYPHMTARENISFGLKHASDLSSDDVEERVTDTAEMLGIERHLEQRPNELSGGQQQRVALGRAIVRQPDVFLMDEPLSNLDAKLRTQMRTELQELHDELGVTTIYVTHDQEEAMTMADQLAVLNGGELQQAGTPLECYHEPANRFVASFIGSPQMNLFDFDIEDGTFVREDFEYDLPPDLEDETSVERSAVTVGIRPEDIVIQDGPSDNSLLVTVDVIEKMGDLTHVYTNVLDQQCVITVSGDEDIETGEQVHMTFPPSRIHIFDDETGEAIKNRGTEADTSVVIQ